MVNIELVEKIFFQIFLIYNYIILTFAAKRKSINKNVNK